MKSIKQHCPEGCHVGYENISANCCFPAGKSLGILMIFSCLQEDTVLCFFFPPWDYCISTQTTALSRQTHWKHYLNHIFLSSVSFAFGWKFETPTTSSRSFHLFLWQIKILKSRWGVSICYTNLRSVHQPLIHDLWKQLTFSWSCLPFFSQNRHTAQTESVSPPFCLLLIAFNNWLSQL